MIAVFVFFRQNQRMENITQSQIVDQIIAITGNSGWVDDAHALEPYITETRGLWRGNCLGVARPDSTIQVAQIMKYCHQSGVPVTPQSGNTGLVGGGVPNGGIILSLNRMNTIREIDAVNNTMTVDAGCILSHAQTAAENVSKLFPLSLAAEGTCQIGGNLSTNAGGVQVLRYGNARDLVLGLEVVLADGQIWNGLQALRKNNTGYDLKQIFMGSEGTLGIITGAVLKLFAKPKSSVTALVSVHSMLQTMDLFATLNDELQGLLSAFEVINENAMTMTLDFMDGAAHPLENKSDFTVLIEATSGDDQHHLQNRLEQALMNALQHDVICDATIAQNQTQAKMFWAIRETIPEAQKIHGGSIKHDVAVPISKVADFMDQATKLVEAEMLGIKVIAFGHAGDGNIHFNLTQPTGIDRDTFMGQWDHFNHIVHQLVHSMDGSFSAEHGVGQLKVKDVMRYNDPVGIDLMRTMKQALDPKNILNPGKVIPPITNE